MAEIKRTGVRIGVILIASVILGGFYYATQIIKQGSIERQQEIEIEQKKRDQLDKEIKEQQEKAENLALFDVCLTVADQLAGWSFVAVCNADDRMSGGDGKKCEGYTSEPEASIAYYECFKTAHHHL